MTRSKLLQSCSSAALLLLFSSPADAQTEQPSTTDAAQPQADSSSDIVVTANRRSQTALSVPSNISAVSGASLASSGITDAAGVSRLVPGLAVFDEGIRASGNRNTFNLRGLNANAAYNNDDAPDKTQDTVSTYFGEAPVFFPFKLVDIERVEVLRGPQGTLYGSGSVGGTVRFIPAAPDPSHFYVEGTGEISSTQHADKLGGSFYGTVNLPITSNLAVRVNGGYDYQSGWIDAVGLVQQTGTPFQVGSIVLADPTNPLTSLPAAAPVKKDANSASVRFARAAVAYTPTDDLSVTLRGVYQENKANNRNEDNPYFAGQEYKNYKAFTDPQESKLLLGNLDVSVDVGFAKVISATSYSTIKTKSVSDSSGYLRTNLSSFYFGFPRLFVPASRDAMTKTFSQELRLVSNTTGPIDYVIGAFYLRRSLDFKYNQVAPGIGAYTNAVLGIDPPVAFGDVLATGYTDQTFNELAGFGELTWHATPQLDFTGGVRIFRQKTDGTSGLPLPYSSRTFQYFLEGVANNDFLFGGFVPYRYNKTNTIFKANAAYKFSSRLLAYATFSQGLRAGGSNALPATDALGSDNRPFQTFDLDSVNNYEVGLKGSLRSIDFTISAFHIDWTNFQTSLLTPLGISYIANVPKTKSDGVEVQLSFRPFRGLSGTVGYTYVDARVATPFEALAGDPSTVVQKGTRLPSSSRHTLTASADYEIVADDTGAVRLHSDVSYRSSFNSTFGNFPSISTNDFYRFSPITVVNASLSVRRGPIEGTLFVNNIGGSRGESTATIASFYGVTDQGYGVMRPRTVGLRLTYSGR